MTLSDSPLLTVRQFCDKYPWPNQGALRAIIMNAPTNGFAKAFKRVGRRVLVDQKVFWETVEHLQTPENRPYYQRISHVIPKGKRR